MSDLLVIDEMGAAPVSRALWRRALEAEGLAHDLARMDKAEAKRARKAAHRLKALRDARG